jgi:hypothetical protein
MRIKDVGGGGSACDCEVAIGSDRFGGVRRILAMMGFLRRSEVVMQAKVYEAKRLG